MRSIAAVMYQQGLPAPYADSRPLKIQEIEVDGPQEGEVLIEIQAAGLCHSDLSQVAGLRKRTVPVVMGHEGAGIVREVGPGVSKLAPGDHVVMTVGGRLRTLPILRWPTPCTLRCSERIKSSRSSPDWQAGGQKWSDAAISSQWHFVVFLSMQ